MGSETALSQGFLSLEDRAFWSDAAITFEKKCEVMGTGPGLYLDGPVRASAAEHRTVPYVGARVTGGDDHLHVSLRRKLSLFAVRLDDNRFYAAAASRVALSDDPIPVQQPKRAADERDVTAEFFDSDLARLGAVLEPGSYRAWAVLFDCASNPVTTRVAGQEILDPEVLALVEQRRAQRFAGPVSPPPGRPWPHFGRDPASPPVPDDVGVNLAAARVTVMEEGVPMIVRGSFRLPVLPCERIDPALRAELLRRRAAAGDDPAGQTLVADAVIVLHLVLVGNTRSTPQVLRLAAPAIADPSREGAAVGYFNLDLHRHLVLDAQTYTIWSVAGGELRGPALAALVAPELLQRGRG